MLQLSLPVTVISIISSIGSTTVMTCLPIVYTRKVSHNIANIFIVPLT